MVLRSFLGPFPCRTVTSPVHHARIPKFTGIPCNYFYHFYQVHDFIVVSDDGLANLCGFHFQASFDSSNKSSCKYRNSRVDITRISINSHQQTTMPAQKQVPEYIERWRFVQLLVFCIIPNKRIWFSVLLFSNAKKVFAFVYYGCKGEREPMSNWEPTYGSMLQISICLLFRIFFCARLFAQQYKDRVYESSLVLNVRCSNDQMCLYWMEIEMPKMHESQIRMPIIRELNQQ